MKWIGLSELDEERWDPLIKRIIECGGIYTCPNCQHQLRFFFSRMRAPEGAMPRGGFWVWCGNCGRNYHATVSVPDWWIDDPAVDRSKLAVPPDYLESIWPISQRRST